MTGAQRAIGGALSLGECAPIEPDDLIGLLPVPVAISHKKAGEQVLLPAEESSTIICIISGWAFSYRLFDDGRRQIINLHLPGNLIGLSTVTRDVSAWGCEAVTDLTYISLCRDAVMAQVRLRPDLALRIVAEAVRGEILLRERLADVARRSARKRVANFLFELYCRSQSVADFAGGQAASIPLTQDKIADAVGLTPIHVSRTLREFKLAGITRYLGHDLQIVDPEQLRRISTFDDAYVQWLKQPSFSVRSASKAGAGGQAAPAGVAASVLSAQRFDASQSGLR